jgi:aryl-alcohol dehydrogenase (NADP+)
MERFFELGGNFIDTANAYAAGKSEEIIGRGLKGRRDDVIVATKGFFPRGSSVNDMGNTRRNLRRQIEDSLRRLDMDYVDLYQIHMWDALTPVEETLSVLSDLVHEGKIHYIGACNLTGWQLAMFMERAEDQGFERFVTIQPQYSLACRDIEQELLPAAYQYDLGVLAWSPLAFGLLSGKYGSDGKGPDGARLSAPTDDDIMRKWKERTFTEANFRIAERLRQLAEEHETTSVALAIRWVLEQPQLTSAIIGPRSVQQLEGNFAALEVDLSEELFAELEELTEPKENYLEYMQGGVNLRRVAELEFE